MLLVILCCLFCTTSSLSDGECICDDLDFFCKMSWNNILLLPCQEVAGSFNVEFSIEGQISDLKYG